MEKGTNEPLKRWEDHPDNPLIDPPWPEWIIADPAVVLPENSPAGEWHLFAHSLRGIHHFKSRDGIHWVRHELVCGGIRPYVFVENRTYYLLYESYSIPFLHSRILMRTSENLADWSEAETLLAPEFRWERQITATMGNPCLVKTDERYLLYYSAGSVFLGDLGFTEPRYIGVASGEGVQGPYIKSPHPVIVSSPRDPYRNLCAGAIKVLPDKVSGSYYGFNNGIYRIRGGRTRSAILLLSSEDGMNWEYLYREPIISPGPESWKRALVYQLDVKRSEGKLLIYYNARSGWIFGKERIGLATCADTA